MPTAETVEPGWKTVIPPSLAVAPWEEAHRACAVGRHSDCISNAPFSWALGKPIESHFICPIKDGLSLSATPEPTDQRHICISGCPELTKTAKMSASRTTEWFSFPCGWNLLTAQTWPHRPGTVCQKSSERKLANVGSKPGNLLRKCASKGGRGDPCQEKAGLLWLFLMET